MSLTRHYDLQRISLQEDYRHCHKLTKEYETTQSLLTELPKQLKHSIQIPLGPHCFTSGKLIHTNEVQVLLGDNYFIECTSSHAIGICQRRIQHIQTKVKAIQQELDSLNESIKHSTNLFEQTINEEGEEIIEIKEEYHSDDDTNETTQAIDDNSSYVQSDQQSSSFHTSNQTIKSSALTGRGNLTDAEFDAYWDMLAEAESQQDNDSTSDHDIDVTNNNNISEQDNDADDVHRSSHIPDIQSPADIFANIQARKQRTSLTSSSNTAVKPNTMQSNINKPSPASSQSTQTVKRVSFNESPSVAHINNLSTTSIPVNHSRPDHPVLSQPVVSSLPSSHLDIDGPPSSNPAMRAAFSGSIMERFEPRFDEPQTVAPTAPIKKTLSKFKAARMGLIDDDEA